MYYQQKKRILSRLDDICIDVAIERCDKMAEMMVTTFTFDDVKVAANDIKNLTVRQLIELVESL
jgi:hypothetical protein